MYYLLQNASAKEYNERTHMFYTYSATRRTAILTGLTNQAERKLRALSTKHCSGLDEQVNYKKLEKLLF